MLGIKKNALIVILSFAILFPLMASANLIIPDSNEYKKVDYCFKIDNLRQKKIVFHLVAVLDSIQKCYSRCCSRMLSELNFCF